MGRDLERLALMPVWVAFIAINYSFVMFTVGIFGNVAYVFSGLLILNSLACFEKYRIKKMVFCDGIFNTLCDYTQDVLCSLGDYCGNIWNGCACTRLRKSYTSFLTKLQVKFLSLKLVQKIGDRLGNMWFSEIMNLVLFCTFFIGSGLTLLTMPLVFGVWTKGTAYYLYAFVLTLLYLSWIGLFLDKARLEGCNYVDSMWVLLSRYDLTDLFDFSYILNKIGR